MLDRLTSKTCIEKLGSTRQLLRATAMVVITILLVYLIEEDKVAAQSQLRQEVADQRFGIIESYDSPEDADDLGVAWTRVLFHWSEVQASGADSWVPKISDEQLERELDAGREVVGLLIGVAEWARDTNGLPRGLWLAADDPGNTWANFVREAVGRYQGRIDHWTIWNEPDIRETEIAHTWDGSVADFAQLQRVAYLTAKKANPAVVVHLSAFTYWADYYGGTDQYMVRLLDELLKDPQAYENNAYFDVATAHLYFQPGQVFDLLTFFTEIMRVRQLNQPIWLVETNAPPRDDPAWPVEDWFLSVTLEEQAAFMPQALGSALAAGAERIAVYKLKDNEDDRFANPEPFGLVRMDGSRRPAFDTYRVAIDMLSGSEAAARERWDEIGQIRLQQSGKTTTILFARLPAEGQALVEAQNSVADLVDMWGNSQEITAENGVFRIMLPPASCSQSIGDYCMIGGPTYYLVQSVPATSTPMPTATDTASPTSTATATERPTSTAVKSATPSEAPIPAGGETVPVSVTPRSSDAPTHQPARAASTTVGASDAGETQPDENGDSPSWFASPGIWLLGGAILVALVMVSGWMRRRRHDG